MQDNETTNIDINDKFFNLGVALFDFINNEGATERTLCGINNTLARIAHLAHKSGTLDTHEEKKCATSIWHGFIEARHNYDKYNFGLFAGNELRKPS